MKATHPGSQGNPGLPNVPCPCRPDRGNSWPPPRPCCARLSCERMVGSQGWPGGHAGHCTRGRAPPQEAVTAKGGSARPWVSVLASACPAGTCGSPTHGWGVSPRQAETGWWHRAEKQQSRGPGSCLRETLGSALTPESSTAPLAGHPGLPGTVTTETPPDPSLGQQWGPCSRGRTSSQGPGEVGTHQRLSPKCPSRRGPGGNRIGW